MVDIFMIFLCAEKDWKEREVAADLPKPKPTSRNGLVEWERESIDTSR